MSNWNIRAAEPNDAKGLESCMHAAYSIYQQRMPTHSLPPLEADYGSEINDFPTWVAESNGKIVGGLIMSFDARHATLSNVAVDPKFQGHGLGRGLMAFAETKAREHNFTKIRLATHVLLTENVSLYEHLGWKQISSDDTRILFEKELT